MNFLNVCFFGYGSIAKRHIKNLVLLCKKKKIKLNIDLVRHKKNSEGIDSVNNIYYKSINKNDKYDIIFITNPTALHYETLKNNIKNAKLFFIEKPLVCYDDINKISNLNISKNKVYVACPLRYKKIIQYIKNKINQDEVISVRAICSSYLPEWRKGNDYKKSYSANKKLGGGARLDLIHEWDYLKYLFGEPKSIIYKYGKYSKLKINTEDVATYIADYNDKLIELHVDYFGREYQRKIEIYTNDDVIVTDLKNNSVTYLNKKKVVKFKEDRDDYQLLELKNLIDIYLKNKINNNNLFDAIKTINLTRGKI